jgi:glycosyltransferase involved in cell wall biosynthesis
VISRRRREVTPVRLVRIISRLNVGGPAIQAITLTQRLTPLGYETTLIRGREAPNEGSMDYLAEELNVRPMLIGLLERNPGPQDLVALLLLARALRARRPHIVHSHAAKAGTLGRLAALLAFRPSRRPVLIHTFHGHSLSGYFTGWRNAAFLGVERFLARRTDRLIAVSAEVRDELAQLGVAPPDRFTVVPLGFDLSPFLVEDPARTERRRKLRIELGIPDDALVVTLVARLVPIKRVDRFLRVAARLRDVSDVRFVVVGDGELRDELRTSPEARAMSSQLIWAGFRRDMPDVYFASDVVVQTSDNEGTPVALIEAQAAGVPVVTTAVGGVASAVLDGETGRITAVDEEEVMAGVIGSYLGDEVRRREHGEQGRRHAEESFTLNDLVVAIDRLYRRSLDRRPGLTRHAGRSSAVAGLRRRRNSPRPH